MDDFWLSKFEELAKFNGDNDQSKYNDAYIEKMKALQSEYNDRLVRFAQLNGDLVY